VADAPVPPGEKELREALARVTVGDLLAGTATSLTSLGFAKLAPEARDLEQTRLAVEALRALLPVLGEAGHDELVRDLEAATDSLKLAYARAVRETQPDGS
jgi:hypothetical protein